MAQVQPSFMKNKGLWTSLKTGLKSTLGLFVEIHES